MELKSCPFCGKDASVLSRDDDWNSCRPSDTYWMVGCDTEDCIGEWSSDQYFVSKEEAVTAWNTRKEA